MQRSEIMSMLKPFVLVLVLFELTNGQLTAFPGEDENAKEEENIDLLQTELSPEVSNGVQVIADALNYKCPKGYRCLPVLQCLPCDYGTYKSKQGSGMCRPCPGGCTTLRKGAEYWRECVPKCPPGYEESACGKTCTRCRPGYFKSTWKNARCHRCPSGTSWEPNTWGLRRMRECYATSTPSTTAWIPSELTILSDSTTSTTDAWSPSDTMTTTTDSWSPPDTMTTTTTDAWSPSDLTTGMTTTSSSMGESCYDEFMSCTVSPYVLRGKADSCINYCECSPDMSGAEDSFYWQKRSCSPGTWYSDEIGSCLWKDQTTCEADDSRDTPTDWENSDSPVVGCPTSSCSFNTTGLIKSPGSNCESFCQCTSMDNSYIYHWVQMPCGPGTLFDVHLGLCNHENLTVCEDSWASSDTTNSADSATSSSSTTTTTGTTTTTSPTTTSTTTTTTTSSQATGNVCEYEGQLRGRPCSPSTQVHARMFSLPDTGCTEYCECDTTSSKWTHQSCQTGLLFDGVLCWPESLVDPVTCENIGSLD